MFTIVSVYFICFAFLSTDIQSINGITVRHTCMLKFKYLFALPSQCHGSKTCENSNQVEWLRFPAHPSGCLNVVAQSKEQHQWMITKTIFYWKYFFFYFHIRFNILYYEFESIIKKTRRSYINMYMAKTCLWHAWE